MMRMVPRFLWGGQVAARSAVPTCLARKEPSDCGSEDGDLAPAPARDGCVQLTLRVDQCADSAAYAYAEEEEGGGGGVAVEWDGDVYHVSRIIASATADCDATVRIELKGVGADGAGEDTLVAVVTAGADALRALMQQVRLAGRSLRGTLDGLPLSVTLRSNRVGMYCGNDSIVALHSSKLHVSAAPTGAGEEGQGRVEPLDLRSNQGILVRGYVPGDTVSIANRRPEGPDAHFVQQVCVRPDGRAERTGVAPTPDGGASPVDARMADDGRADVMRVATGTAAHMVDMRVARPTVRSEFLQLNDESVQHALVLPDGERMLVVTERFLRVLRVSRDGEWRSISAHELPFAPMVDAMDASPDGAWAVFSVPVRGLCFVRFGGPCVWLIDRQAADGQQVVSAQIRSTGAGGSLAVLALMLNGSVRVWKRRMTDSEPGFAMDEVPVTRALQLLDGAPVQALIAHEDDASALTVLSRPTAVGHAPVADVVRLDA